MFTKNCWGMLFLLIWLLTSHLDLGDGQSQNAIGAHRAFDKTSFSCAGRPAGYYADIETGCQVYHMCDGLGRQFSYSCPNTTLFQQRMLICDHWYMVNCSKAESDYAANLLIGQRDKPFVNDEESNLRTPRPDLLDRPYAPDYSGESFRRQYNKQISSVQNQITDDNAQKDTDRRTSASQLAPGQQRWKIPPPSRTILPPAYEPQIDEISTSNPKPTGNVRLFTPTIAKQTTEKSLMQQSSTKRPTVSPHPATLTPTRLQNFPSSNNAALLQRQQHDSKADDHDDLGTSHSTRYNTSADFNSAEAQSPKKLGSAPNRKIYYTATTPKTATKSAIKVPSKIYEPPFLYPIYNHEEGPTSTAHQLHVSTAAPFVAATHSASSTTTTASPLTRPTTLAGKPFTPSLVASVTSTTPQIVRNSNTLEKNQPHHSIFDSHKLFHDARKPSPAQGFKPPTPRPPMNSAKTLRPPTTAKFQKTESTMFDYSSPTISTSDKGTIDVKPQLPSNDLLPPFQEFVQHDVATTQGPPIYYDWKIPSNGLEPPKLDPPIGVDGREYSDIAIDYNSISTTGGFTPSTTFGVYKVKTAETTKNPFSSNPFFVSKSHVEINAPTTKTPASRSVKETAQPKGVQKFTRADAILPTASPSSQDLTQIRKDLSVPEYLFPLEDIGRTGYLASDAYNSFQLKIPDGRNDNEEEHLHWFGENPKCPECHPSYVNPGTCEPCLRR